MREALHVTGLKCVRSAHQINCNLVAHGTIILKMDANKILYECMWTGFILAGQ
jgi:hypothetical protein